MRDPDYFRDRLTVLNDTAAWDVSVTWTLAIASTLTR